MKIGLRICVNTLPGLQLGVPNLLRLLDAYQVHATFYFAVGPDRSGRLFARTKLPDSQLISLSSRLVRSLTPAPVMAEKGVEVMRSVAAAGHEIGLLAYDPQIWFQKAAHADEEWTRSQIRLGIGLFESVFGQGPKTMAAPGWQVNSHLLAEQQQQGFEYASDVRGKRPFTPEMSGVESDCIQLPTTLSTMSDLLETGADVNPENVHEFIYAESQYLSPHGHIYSLDAEVEGIDFLKQFEKLVVMWRGYGEGMVALKEIFQGLDRSALAKHRIGWSNELNSERYDATQSLAI